jgi:hypothetical protein
MNVRFCPVCEDEMATEGGVCPKGHDVEVSLVESAWSVRDQVESVFDAAGLRVDSFLQASVATMEPPTAPPPVAPPVPPRALRTPPPPPPPAAPKKHPIWGELETAAATPAADDPIQVFAPPPHMDWGPATGRLRGRLRSRKTA